MDILNYTDIINSSTITMVVNEVGFPLFVLVIGGFVVVIFTNHLTTKSTKKIKNDEKLIILKNLLTEVYVNQNRLYPLAECVEKVLDNEIHECSEMESTPNKLNFEMSVYDSWSKIIDFPGNEIKHNAIEYYSGIKEIEERYINLEIVHSASHDFLDYLIIRSEKDENMGRHSTPSLKEIVDFFRYTKQVYDLGEELTRDLKK